MLKSLIAALVLSVVPGTGVPLQNIKAPAKVQPKAEAKKPSEPDYAKLDAKAKSLFNNQGLSCRPYVSPQHPNLGALDCAATDKNPPVLLVVVWDSGDSDWNLLAVLGPTDVVLKKEAAPAKK